MRSLAGLALLVVDGDAACLARWRRRLNGVGARVICSASVDSALANAVTFPVGTFHAALIEHRPPRVDAIELAATLRALPGMRSLPVIVVADAGADAASAAGDAGGSMVLQRPAGVEQVTDKLTAALLPLLPAPGWQASGARRSLDPSPEAGRALAAQTANQPSSDEPIDWSQLESLRMVDPGGANGVAGKAIALYLEHAPGLIAEILTYRVTGDLSNVRQAAHALRSSSASLGANAVAGLSATIETAAARSDFEIIDSIASTLESEYRRAEDALRGALPRSAAPSPPAPLPMGEGSFVCPQRERVPG